MLGLPAHVVGVGHEVHGSESSAEAADVPAELIAAFRQHNKLDAELFRHAELLFWQRVKRQALRAQSELAAGLRLTQTQKAGALTQTQKAGALTQTQKAQRRMTPPKPAAARSRAGTKAGTEAETEAETKAETKAEHNAFALPETSADRSGPYDASLAPATLKLSSTMTDGSEGVYDGTGDPQPSAPASAPASASASAPA